MFVVGGENVCVFRNYALNPHVFTTGGRPQAWRHPSTPIITPTPAPAPAPALPGAFYYLIPVPPGVDEDEAAAEWARTAPHSSTQVHTK